MTRNRLRTAMARGVSVLWVLAAITVAMPGVSAAQGPGGATAQAPGAPAPATAPKDYLIGIGDVLTVSVWAHPELARDVEVDRNGNIQLPPVGEIKAAGLTSRALSDRIADRLATYLRQGSATVDVIVKEYVSMGVFVSGAVVRPGRYGAAVLPGLYDIINLAGGALVNGDLSRVTIIRRRGNGPRQLTVDVASAMRDGTEMNLPELRPGDTVIVPTSISLVGGAGNGQGCGVLGAVRQAGLYPVGPDEDLWEALALAGGPTNEGNLANVRVLTTDSHGPGVVLVNLQETLQHGNKRPYMVKPGDIIFVDQRGVSLWGVVSSLLSTTRDVANLVAVVRVLQNNP